MKNLLIILEEFGLSKNEAKAYLTLLSNGPQSSSDLAYKANIPRPKIYSIINRLVKRDLAMIINRKPIMVDAIPPVDAFNIFIKQYEESAQRMKDAILLLEELRNSKRDPMQERTYKIISDMFIDIINNAINNAKHSVMLTINALGMNIINECRDAIKKRSKEIIIKVLSDLILDGIEVRKSHVHINSIIIDEEKLFLIDAMNNRCYLFNDKELVNTYLQIFYNEWERCLIIEQEPLA